VKKRLDLNYTIVGRSDASTHRVPTGNAVSERSSGENRQQHNSLANLLRISPGSKI